MILACKIIEKIGKNEFFSSKSLRNSEKDITFATAKTKTCFSSSVG